MDLKSKLKKQIMHFGIVGCTAALVNFSVVVVLVELHLLQPLYANIFAFAIAFQVSYFGHRHLTFNGTTAKHHIAITRLLFVSGISFFINEGLFYFFLKTFYLPYPLALILVLTILPVVTFIFGKFWVFR